MNQALTQQRIRITFGKTGALRFVGHLDLVKTWERVLRRATIPLEYSQGFNPRPRMQFAAALPVGVTSESEYLDAWLTQRLEDGFPDAWVAQLQTASPPGLIIYTIEDVPIKMGALPTLVTHADYVITLITDEIEAEDLQQRAETLMAQTQIERSGFKKPYDLRPLIESLSLDDSGSLLAHLTAGDQGNGRPDELVDALGLALSQVRIHRRYLYLKPS